tara:strand:- start:2625 stop:3512 length:888 start_codon:yes stop_codon:yes gene_type:complete
MKILRLYLASFLFSILTGQVATEHLYYGAPSLGLAGSDVAIPKQSWSVFVNPAGSAYQKSPVFIAGSESLFGQDYLSHSFTGANFQLSGIGSFGITLENFSVNYGGNTLSNETAIGFHQGILLRSDRNSTIAFGYGVRNYSVDYGKSAGVSGDGSDGINLGSHNSLGVDVGVMASLAKRIRFGARAFNINSPSIGEANSSVRLPQRVQVGIAFSPYDLVWTTAAITRSVGHATNFHAGMSYAISDNFFLRSGIQTDPNRFATGFGVIIKKIHIDYGLLTHPVLPVTHQVSIEVNR